MSIICGVISKTSQPVESQWQFAMIKACEPWPRDESRSVYLNSALITCLQQFNTPQSPLAQQPYTDEHYYLVFDGRLDNRAELAGKLAINLNEQTTDENLLLAAYKKYQNAMGLHLIGDFTIVIYDRQSQALYLIRDHFGVRPLFIAENDQFFAFSSNKAALLALPWVDSSINKQWIADNLTTTEINYHATPYNGISSFSPAHWRFISPEQDTTEKYWQLDINHQLPNCSEQEYIAQFNLLFNQAVEDRLRCYGDISSELSGGLDSTSIAATAVSKLNGQPLHVYSHMMSPELKGNTHPYSDESELSQLLIEQYPNMQLHKVHSNDVGIIDTVRHANIFHSGPERRDFSAIGDQIFVNLYNSKRRTLLSGFGGDQLVTGYGHGWEEELVKGNNLKQLWHQTRQFTDHKTLQLKTFLAAIAMYKFKKKKPAEKKTLKHWHQHIERTGINASFAEQYGYPQRFINHHFWPLRGSVKQREHQAINAADILYRLEDSATGAASYGIEYRYPMLDIRLLQFCLALPTQFKVANGVKRRMIRQAMQGVLPDEIRQRHVKTGGAVPTLRNRVIKDRQAILALIEQAKHNSAINEFINLETLYDYIYNLTPSSKTQFGHQNLIKLTALIIWKQSLEKKQEHDNKLL
ncbi:asparagine synthetase B family protein [Pseudoalteromonas phenolica]|uniref:asparagine synthetase B family protein n=1 Tax=Pseudoalteromonas phenolica TaxID=161398 RepID=UPI0038507BC1